MFVFVFGGMKLGKTAAKRLLAVENIRKCRRRRRRLQRRQESVSDLRAESFLLICIVHTVFNKNCHIF